jgi:hypothetical protein
MRTRVAVAAGMPTGRNAPFPIEARRSSPWTAIDVIPQTNDSTRLARVGRMKIVYRLTPPRCVDSCSA